MPPLTGIRIVTMAQNAPGPIAAARLAAEGASILKVEPPAGDPLEAMCPGWYRELHVGVEVRRLDLKSAGGREAMRSHLADADLFLASQRPAALARLGLDADTLLAPASPLDHLRWLNIVGERARPEVPGHDLTYMAKAGLIGRDLPQSVFADVLAGERAFSTALLLLRQPPGSRAEVGLFDSLVPLGAPMRHGLTGPGGLLGGRLAAYGVYEAREGRVAVAALEPHFRQRLYEALHLPLDAPLADAMRARTADEWERWALERDLPLTRVR